MGKRKGDERQSRGIALTVGMFVGILVFWFVLLSSNNLPAEARFLEAFICGCSGIIVLGIYPLCMMILPDCICGDTTIFLFAVTL